MAARVSVIVGFAAGVSEVEQRAVYATLGTGKPVGMVKSRRHIVKVLPERVQEVLATLRADARVAYAEVDSSMPLALTPNDPLLSAQWHHAKIGTSGTGGAWDTQTGAAGIIIAILDSGIDGTHPDLTGRLVGGYNTFTATAAAGDWFGHGTKVAGVAVSTGNNAIGGAGVAYGCKLMPVVISDNTGYATASRIAIGIDWAADHGAKIINISISGLAGSSTVKAAAEAARAQGVWVVAAAGNSGTVDPYPATTALFSVTATDQNDALWSGSSRGAFVDLAAPGYQIRTTSPGATYSVSTGTSFAAPIVAGVAALLWSEIPTLTLADVETALTTTATDLGTAGYDQSFGYGRVNAAAAMASITTPTADTTPPVVTITSPANGATASGSLTVSVTATDAGGVASVTLYLDGALVGTDVLSPYTFVLNTTPYTAGTHTLVAKATDVAGNVGTSAAVTFTVAAPVVIPSSTGTVVITSAVITGGNLLTVIVTASDPAGITKVDCYLDGVLKRTKTTATSYKFTIGVGSLRTGSRHAVQVKATTATPAEILSTVVEVVK